MVGVSVKGHGMFQWLFAIVVILLVISTIVNLIVVTLAQFNAKNKFHRQLNSQDINSNSDKKKNA